MPSKAVTDMVLQAVRYCDCVTINIKFDQALSWIERDSRLITWWIYVAECNCFGHADECVYNQTVSNMHLSLNIYGEYEGGGLCIGCRVSVYNICITIDNVFYEQVKLITKIGQH